MLCNGCWNPLPPDTVYIASCSHVFCEQDARKIFSGTRACPCCGTMLSGKGGIRGNSLDLNRDSDSKALALCGLQPAEILGIAGKAIRFYEFQHHLASERERAVLTARAAEKAREAREVGERLIAVDADASAGRLENRHLRDQLADANEQLHAQAAVKEELERQKRKLEDLYEAEKVKNSEQMQLRARSGERTSMGPTTATLFRQSSSMVVPHRNYSSDSELNSRQFVRPRLVAPQGASDRSGLVSLTSSTTIRQTTPDESPFRLRTSPFIARDRFARLHSEAAKGLGGKSSTESSVSATTTSSLLRRPETPAFARFHRK